MNFVNVNYVNLPKNVIWGQKKMYNQIDYVNCHHFLKRNIKVNNIWLLCVSQFVNQDEIFRSFSLNILGSFRQP